MAIALIFFLIALVILLRIEKEYVPKWMFIGLVGTIVGATIMLIAPGNFIRYSQSEITEGEPTHLYLFYRSISTVKQFSQYCIYPTIIYIIIFILHLIKGKDENKKRKIKLSLLFFCSAIVAISAMVAAPIFPERVWFGIITLILVATMLLCANLDFTIKSIRIANYTVCLFLTVLFTISFTLGYEHLKIVDVIWVKRAESVQEQKEKHIQDAILMGKYQADTNILSLPRIGDVPLDSTNWMGTAYGGYLGIKSVTIVDTTLNNKN